MTLQADIAYFLRQSLKKHHRVLSVSTESRPNDIEVLWVRIFDATLGITVAMNGQSTHSAKLHDYTVIDNAIVHAIETGRNRRREILMAVQPLLRDAWNGAERAHTLILDSRLQMLKRKGRIAILPRSRVWYIVN